MLHEVQQSSESLYDTNTVYLSKNYYVSNHHGKRKHLQISLVEYKCQEQFKSKGKFHSVRLDGAITIPVGNSGLIGREFRNGFRKIRAGYKGFLEFNDFDKIISR